jgi:hypothetical protein
MRYPQQTISRILIRNKVKSKIAEPYQSEITGAVEVTLKPQKHNAASEAHPGAVEAPFKAMEADNKTTVL